MAKARPMLGISAAAMMKGEARMPMIPPEMTSSRMLSSVQPMQKVQKADVSTSRYLRLFGLTSGVKMNWVVFPPDMAHPHRRWSAGAGKHARSLRMYCTTGEGDVSRAVPGTAPPEWD